MIQHYKIRSMPGGGNIGDYYAKVSEQERGERSVGNYYAKGEALKGRWLGEMAREWGIEGREILPGDAIFANLNEGLDPKGEMLGQRTIKGRKPTFALAARAARHDLGRKPTPEEVKVKMREMETKGPIRFIDFTASMPKGFSIAAVTANDEALRKLARESYEKAFVEGLSQLAARRVRGEGSAPDERETTGKILVAAWEHHLNRGLSAHLHFHLLTPNFTIGKDGKKYALEAADMALAKNWAEARAASLIADGAQKLGYEIELTRDERGNVTGWDIAGISQEAKNRLSEQNAAIKEACAEYARKNNGIWPSRKEEALIQKRLSEKQKKNSREVMNDDIQRQQIEKLGTEWNGVLATVEAARKRRLTIKPDRTAAEKGAEAARAAVASALSHLEERHQIWPRWELEKEALLASFGKATPDEILRAIDVALGQEKEAVLVDRRGGIADPLRSLSTPGAVRRELYAIDRIAANRGICRQLAKFQYDAKYSKEQNEAARFMCELKDRFGYIIGPAGAGKSTMSKGARDALAKAGNKVFVAAPTAAARDVWRKDGFEAETLARLAGEFKDPAKRKKYRGSVLFVDEAAMASGRQGVDLIRAAESQLDMRIFLIGDEKQISGVEAMDFARVLRMHGKIATAELQEIRRQKHGGYLEAVQVMSGVARNAKGERLAASVPDGVMMLDKLGWVHEIASEGMDAMEGVKVEAGAYLGAAARDYLQATKGGTEFSVKDKGGEEVDTAMLIAPTHTEIRSLNDIIRTEMKRAGVLDEKQEKVRTAAVSLNLTEAQKLRPERYESGGKERLLLKGSKPRFGLTPGEMTRIEKVVRVTKGKSSWHELVLQNGSRARLSKNAAKDFDVCHGREIGFAPGDRLMVKQNQKGLNLINGDRLTVRKIEKDGTIVTKEGKSIPPSFAMVTHGYCVTAHASQGSKALRAIVAASSMSAKLSYVALSRGVMSCGLFVPDKKHFMLSCGDPGHRESVLDEVRSRQERSVEAGLRAVAAYSDETKSQMRGWFVRIGENVRSSIKRHLRSPARFAIKMAGRMAQIQAREAVRDAARQRREVVAKAALARVPMVETPSRSSGGRER